MQEYLVRKRSWKQQRRAQWPVAHLWDGSDTLCRLWSTGKLRRDRHEVTSDAGRAQICLLCTGEELARQPFSGAVARPPALTVGMDEAKGEREVPPLSAPLGEAFVRFAPPRALAEERLAARGSELCVCGHERQEHAHGIGCPRQPRGEFRLAEKVRCECSYEGGYKPEPIAGERLFCKLCGGEIRSPTRAPAPGYDEVLEGLRRVRKDVGPEPRRAAEQARDERDLDRAVAFLESLPESVKWSEMPGDTAFRCMKCGWDGPYKDLRGGDCPSCSSDQVEPL